MVRVPTGVLSAIVTVAAEEAPGFGVKVTLTLQLAPGAIPAAAVVQSSVMAYCAASAPPRVTALTVTGPAGVVASPVLVFVEVMLFVTGAVPPTLPKARGLGAAAAATPGATLP